ncbi:MAG: hypothetical protein AB7W16_29540, partial [Candidatus Obscuribacterales bacterium]
MQSAQNLSQNQTPFLVPRNTVGSWQYGGTRWLILDRSGGATLRDGQGRILEHFTCNQISIGAGDHPLTGEQLHRIHQLGSATLHPVIDQNHKLHLIPQLNGGGDEDSDDEDQKKNPKQSKRGFSLSIPFSSSTSVHFRPRSQIDETPEPVPPQVLERVGKGEILTPSHSSSKQRPFIHKVPEYVKMLSSGPSSYQETGFGLLRWVMGDDWWQLHALVDDPKGVFKGWGTEWQAAVSAYSKQVYKPWITDWESVGEWGEHVTRRSRHLKNAVKNLLGESASAIPIVGSPVASMVFPKLMGFGSATLSDLKKAVVGGSDKDYYWGLVAQDEEYTQLGGLHEPLSSYD